MISNNELSDRTRSVALRVAAANRITSLDDEIGPIALDETAAQYLRVDAIHALKQSNSATYLDGLRNLLNPATAPTLTDELRGALLQALWPEHLTYPELFIALTPVTDRTHLGSYSFFLHALKLDNFDADAAVAAVNWVKEFAPDNYTHIYFRSLFGSALKEAWAHIADPKVLDAFVGLFIASAKNHFQVTDEQELSDFKNVYRKSSAAIRRALLLRISKLADGQIFDRAIASPWELVTQDDKPWIVQELKSSSSPFGNKWLIAAIFWITRGEEPEALTELWDIAATNTELAFSLEHRFSTDLGSQITQWQKEDFYRKRNRKTPPPIKGQVDKLLQTCLTNSFAWWQLNLALLNADDSSEALDEFTSDLTRTVSWKDADEERRAQILLCANRYLHENSLDEEATIKPNQFFRPAAAGLRAFRLLHDADPAAYERLPSEVWGEWAPALLATSTNDSAGDTATRSEMVRRGFELAPASFLAVLARMLEHNINVFDLARLLSSFIDDKIGALLWAYTPKGEQGSIARDSLLRALVKARYAPTVTFVYQTLQEIAAGREVAGESFEKLAVAASVEFELNAAAIWPHLKTASEAQPNLALAVWEKVANSVAYGEMAFLSQLTPQQIGETYEYLSRTFRDKQSENSEDEGSFLNPAEVVSRVRERMLSYLASAASQSAVDTLRDLEQEYPQLPWLKWYLRRGEEALLRAGWRWPEPRVALEMIVSGAVLPNLSARDLTIASISVVSAQEERRPALPAVAEDAAISTPASEAKSGPMSAIALEPILLVATEWFSSHGGISSLNRSLAIALAAVGNDVVCLVPNASHAEIDLALQDRVRLVSIGRKAGFTDAMLLSTFRPDMLGAIVPKYVVGHDHITGPVAKHISERIAGSRYVHFVHTIPDEIEPYKLDDDGQSRKFDKGEKKSKEQLEHCRMADLVVAIGPRIAAELEASLTDCPGRVFELAPGLDEGLCANDRPLPITGAKRCLFMGRQDDPELKGLAIAAEMLKELSSNPAYSNSKSARLIIRGTDPQQTNMQITRLCTEYKIPMHQVMPRSYSTDTDDLQADFMSTSLLIMPSRVEGFGLVALEAISAGVPVLIGSNSGIVQLLSNVDRAQGNTLPEWQGRTVEVAPDDKLNGSVWAAAVHKLLEDRDRAFQEAKSYRSKLRPILSWRAAATALSKRLAEIDSCRK